MRFLPLLLIGFMVSACASAQQSGSVRQPPAPVFALAEDTLVITHGQSGIQLPKNTGDFFRVDIRAFAADGSDIGVRYEAEQIRSVLSMFATFAPDTSVEDWVQQDVGTIQEENAQAQLQPAEQRQFLGTVPGITRQLVLDGRLVEEITAFDLNGWKIKLRQSYPLGLAAEARSAQERFLQSIGWPGQGASDDQSTPQSTGRPI